MMGVMYNKGCVAIVVIERKLTRVIFEGIGRAHVLWMLC